MISAALRAHLESELPTILDGGLATELERQGLDIEDPLWSAKVLVENPAAIERVHRDYLEAGAEVLITSSYQASFEGLAAKGLSREESEGLLVESIRRADAARRAYADQAQRPILVAASIGPYGAFLHDGSEYRGNYGVSRASLRDFHRDRMTVLAQGGADLLACESLPSYDEMEALIDVLEELTTPRAWVSFSARDEKSIAEGRPIGDCVRRLDEVDQVIAIGINCTAPDNLLSLIREMGRFTRKPIVVYPNSGESWDAAESQWGGRSTPEPLSGDVCAWFEAGARWIGGCCRTTPQDIRSLRAVLS